MHWHASPRRARVWRLCLVAVLCRPLAACHEAPTEPTSVIEAFDRYWEAFDQRYPMFPLKGVDWKALRTQYRGRAATVTTTPELVQLLGEMTATLRDVHTGFVSPSGAVTPTWRATAPMNWDRAQWLEAMPRAGWVQVRRNLGYASLGDGIMYLMVGAWNSSDFESAHLDEVLAQVVGARGLVIDVRPNGGGSDLLAFHLASRFLTRQRTAGSVRVRTGNAHDDLSVARSIDVAPSSPRLTMPVVVLTGRGVWSSNEEFVDVMRQEPSVLTLGDTTGGGSGNPEELPLKDGWRFRVPRWLHLASDGQPIEGRGIAPERYVAWDPAAAAVGRDVVLEAAVAQLKGR